MKNNKTKNNKTVKNVLVEEDLILYTDLIKSKKKEKKPNTTTTKTIEIDLDNKTNKVINIDEYEEIVGDEIIESKNTKIKKLVKTGSQSLLKRNFKRDRAIMGACLIVACIGGLSMGTSKLLFKAANETTVVKSEAQLFNESLEKSLNGTITEENNDFVKVITMQKNGQHSAYDVTVELRLPKDKVDDSLSYKIKNVLISVNVEDTLDKEIVAQLGKNKAKFMKDLESEKQSIEKEIKKQLSDEEGQEYIKQIMDEEIKK